ncbi:response regulator [Opitutus sp. GAS368]|jgi:CheY-like chemotaxis protein|uniref:response regulator n=1 Tax=Opitutus sp. GAS368 TaxID=1882749 RepID=UPI00087BE0C2|nr:response regulator [Opitutus sp. GAS368]SDR81734.1 two-component system, NtrC family, nitrogen regulation response regulator GlnG [Opitutus sp. GAS368]
MARLLLIDDDELLREVLAEVLTSVGHTVTQAADGRSALAHPGIELVITDLVMPGCEGLETIAALRQKRPGLPIIAISGASTNSQIYLKMAAQLGAHRALSKPFEFAELLRLVDELLARPSESAGTSR